VDQIGETPTWRANGLKKMREKLRGQEPTKNLQKNLRFLLEKNALKSKKKWKLIKPF